MASFEPKTFVNNSSPYLNATNLNSIQNAIKTDIDNLEETTETNATNITTNKSNIATNTSNISSLKTSVSTNTTNIATNTANIATNTTNIEANTTAIEGLQETISNKEHFKGYYSTIAEIKALEGESGDFAYCAEDSLKYVYSDDGWMVTTETVPDQTVPKSETTPLMNGTATAGDETSYASGNHVHPTDTTRASKDDLDNLESAVSTLKTTVDTNTANIETNINNIATNATNIEGKQDTLVSGTNIKTINGESLLGSGNISISGSSTEGGSVDIINNLNYSTDDSSYALSAYQGYVLDQKIQANTTNIATNAENILNKQDTLVSGTNIKTINGEDLLGSGDITISGSDSNVTEITDDNVRVWDLEDGTYHLQDGCKIYYYGSTNDTAYIAVQTDYGSFLIVRSENNYKFGTWYVGHDVYYMTTNSSKGWIYKSITTENVKDNLTTTSSGTNYVLSAYQGYVLKELIDNLQTKYKTLTLSSDSWTENDDGYYEYDIEDEDVTSSHIVDVYMDITNQNLLAVGYTDTYDGGFKVITDTAPTEDVIINISIIPVTAS